MSDEQFARLRLMIGDEGLQRLRESFVVVVGLGAVGGYATEALARAGVGRLRLIDCDVIKPSNLNRQLLALNSTVGQPKCDLAAARVLDINPACLVEARQVFVNTAVAPEVLAGEPDLVVDAIDAFGPKVELLTAALTGGLTVISAMGAALRTDPTKLRCGPLSEVQGCPLARRVRQRLRTREVSLEFPCVSSCETVLRSRLGPPDAGETDPRGKPRRSLGSLPTLTGIVGLMVANEGLRLLLGELWPG